MSQITIRGQLSRLPADSLQNFEAILASDKVKTLAAGALIIVGSAGLIGLTLIAPKMLQAFAPLMRMRYRRPLRKVEQRAKLVRAFYYLKETNQITIEEQNGTLWAKLTQKGLKRLHKMNVEIIGIPKPISWDRKWWLIAADIPTKEYSIAGDMLRRKLQQLHFYHLQRTLWLYPYDCRVELREIVNYYGIGKFVTLMQVSKLDIQDKKYLTQFFKKRNIL